MTSKFSYKIDAWKLLVLFTVIELILGGSGRLITFSNISIRHILLMIIVLIEITLLIRNKFRIRKDELSLLLTSVYFVFMLVLGIIKGNTSNAINEFTGYLPIICCPFFVEYFSRYPDIKSIKKIIQTFSFVLAVINLLIWLYCLWRGNAAVVLIINRFLNPYNYGNLSLIGNAIPRVFLKGSIFICIGLIFKLADILHAKAKLIDYAQLFIFIVSLVVTFTLGLYISTFIIVLVLISLNNQKRKLLYYIIPLSVLLSVFCFLLYKYNVFDILSSRFSGDYTLSFKFTQIKSVLSNISYDFLIGKGFGYSVLTDYGYRKVYTYSFEVMWIQLLLHAGIIGFVLFVSHVYSTIKALFLRYKTTKNDLYLVFFLSVVLLCLESFTNPYMNNAIGLTFYALCNGIAKFSNEDTELSIGKVSHI